MKGFEKKKILGIDPGTKVTGYGVVISHPNGYECVIHGVLKPKSTFSPEEKLKFLHKELDKIFEEHEIEAAAIETQFVDKNVQSVLKLGMATGVLLLAAALRDIPVFRYAPKEAKRAATGSGNASKEQVTHMIKALCNLDTKPEEDAADALALAICHAHQTKGLSCMNT